MSDMLGSIVKNVVQLPVAMLTVLYDLIEKLSGEAGQEWLAELKKFLHKENCWIGVEAKKVILKLISGNEQLIIDAADGTEIVAGASEVCDLCIGGADKQGETAGEIAVDVFEMQKDANFAQMAASLSSNVEDLRLTWAQIVGFARKHSVWLRKDGFATFFIFKSHGQFSVLNAFFFGDVLMWYIYPLDFPLVWRADSRPRVVVPKLA